MALDPLNELSDAEYNTLKELDAHLMKTKGKARAGSLDIMYVLGGAIGFRQADSDGPWQVAPCNIRKFLDVSNLLPSDFKLL